MPYLLSDSAAIQLIKSIITDSRILDLEKSLQIQGILDTKAPSVTISIVQANGSYCSPIRLAITTGLPLTFATMYFSAGQTKQFMRGFHHLNHSLSEIVELTRKQPAFHTDKEGVGHGPEGMLTNENMQNDLACCWHTWFLEEIDSEIHEEHADALIHMFKNDNIKVPLNDQQPLIYSRDKVSGRLKCRPIKF